jgi:hypothetical protein
MIDKVTAFLYKESAMKFLLIIFSYLCGLISAIVTFLFWVYLCGVFNGLTEGKYSGCLRTFSIIAGVILGIIVSNIIKNLIYKEPTRFS